jgi:pyrophosphatase PpaX
MSSRTIRAAIFDLDGTLIDSRQAVVDAVAAGVREVLARHAIQDFEPSEAAIMDAMGLPPVEYYQRILPEALFPLSLELKEVATAHEVRALAAGKGRLFPGVMKGLEALRSGGIRLAIVSNAQQPYFVAALDHLGLEPMLDHRECHEELPPGVGSGKPVLLRRALAALGVEAGDALMVGDRREDILAGLELGCATVGMSYGFGSPDELREADLVTGEFSSLVDFVDRFQSQSKA